MAKVPTGEKKQRTAKVPSEATRALLEQIKIEADAIKARRKNVKALGKLLDAVSTLDGASVEKVQEACNARVDALSNTTA